ncbi:MAG: hypothetical protein RLZZ618_1961 [Pseudomonadota bacterium]|jgi:hypothetical protein
MSSSLGSILLIAGLLITVAAQWAIAIHAFAGAPLHGILCFVIPLYVFVYARKHKVGIWMLRAWYLGIALIVVGGVMASS